MMRRTLTLPLLALACLLLPLPIPLMVTPQARADEGGNEPEAPEGSEAPAAEARKLKWSLRTGERFACSNAITVRVETVVRQGQGETKSNESVQRTERFVDVVGRAGENGVLEVTRSYLMHYSKVRGSEDERPVTYHNPVKGKTVKIEEKRRQREVTMAGELVDSFVRRTAGIEMDWRDILPDDAVTPGADEWEADASALARRLSAYLDCGTRSKMRVRYEEDVVRDDATLAKLYVDWTIEGMRDKNLYTKVDLAGDVYFDLALQRVVLVDLVGKIIVRGAILGEGAPRIVKGEGPVLWKSTVKPLALDVEASAPSGTSDTSEEGE